MKTIILFSLLSLLTGFGLTAQNSTEMTKYRVIAYKKGNTQITSVSNEVVTVPAIQLYIPSAFTPNNDGLNDLFGAVGVGIEEYHLTIFDRWGAKIFESNDVNTQWDGTFKGEKVELGTYTYSLAAKGLSKKEVFKSGAVTVVL